MNHRVVWAHNSVGRVLALLNETGDKQMKTHKRYSRNVLGDDIIACQILALPQYHNWRVRSQWRDVTCKRCFATKGKSRF